MVDNFGQSQYDSFKIFLISNYNVRFLPGSSQDVIESLEIDSPSFRITAEFLADETILFHTRDIKGAYFEKILHKIREISPDSNVLENGKKKEFANSKSCSSHGTHNDMLAFFEHVSNCDSCNSYFSKIWSHYIDNKKSGN